MKLLLVVCLLVVGVAAKRKIIPQPFTNTKGLWVGPIVVGTPSQLNQLHLDTTAGQFFFVDAQCKTGCTKNRRAFEPQKSSTFKKLPIPIPYSTTYMGTKQSGRFATDVLTGLGLAKPPRIPIALVDKTTGPFTEYYGDGVMGLGFADSNSRLPVTLFQLITNLALEMAGYSFHVDEFKHTAAEGFTDKGYGIYGGVDTDGGQAYGFQTKKCDANVVYHRISKRHQWTLKVEKITSNGNNFQGGHVLIRPGPFEILGPKSEIDKMHKLVNAQKDGNDFTVDCNVINNLPPIEFTVEGTTHKIEVTDYTVKSDNGKCYLLIKEVDSKISNGADWVFGDVLFRGRCVVFHFKKSSVGFSKLI